MGDTELTNSGILELSGVNSTLELDTYSQQSSGTVKYEIRSNTQFGHISIGNTVGVSGALEIELIDNYAPMAGDSYDILDFDPMMLSGEFDEFRLPVLDDGLIWDTSQLYTTGVLSVLNPVLPGDYNFDSTVDAADYVVWRKNDGTQQGYDEWRANFGVMAGSGSGSNGGSLSNGAVPEPATSGLMIVAILASTLQRFGIRTLSRS